MKKTKLLLIGPRYGLKAVGGIVVLFEDLISFCKSEGIDITIVDTNKSNSSNRFLAYFKILCGIIRNIPSAKHVSLHGTAKDYLLIAPLVILISKLFKKKISLRKFAGSFDEIFKRSSHLSKGIYKYCLRNADFLFFETKFLVNEFCSFNKNTFWLPNSRFANPMIRHNNGFNKRFVFISQVKETKGILEIVEASKHFGTNYTFDVYGPIMEQKIEAILLETETINYRGCLKPEEVVKVLSSYDVLLLPSYHEGEGYPGIILEAFNVGLPIITTEWKSIPEIVMNYQNGLLIPIKNSTRLKDAITFFNDENYSKFSSNSRQSFKNFNSKFVYKGFFEKIHYNQ